MYGTNLSLPREQLVVGGLPPTTQHIAGGGVYAESLFQLFLPVSMGAHP